MDTTTHLVKEMLETGEVITNVNVDEMRIYCIPRHGYAVNMLFMDWSTRKVGLKSLWRLKWNRTYDTNAILPEWPAWMSHLQEP